MTINRAVMLSALYGIETYFVLYLLLIARFIPYGGDEFSLAARNHSVKLCEPENIPLSVIMPLVAIQMISQYNAKMDTIIHYHLLKNSSLKIH